MHPSSSLYLLPPPSPGWWGNRASHPYLLCYLHHGTPPRELTMSASFCISAALTGSAPGQLPRFSRPVASRPTCLSCHRIGPYYTRACISCQRYFCRRLYNLRRSRTLVSLGPVVLIPETALTTSRIFRRGIGYPPARTLWEGVWLCPSPVDGQIPDCYQILRREMFCWPPPQFSFSLHARGLSTLWIPLPLLMVGVEVSWGDAVCPRRDDELAWIGRDDKWGSLCHNRVDSGWLQASKVAVCTSSSPGRDRGVFLLQGVPQFHQAFIMWLRGDFRECAIWEAGDHFVWGVYWGAWSHCWVDAVAMSLVG